MDEVVKNLTPCRFCNSGSVFFKPGGQTWRGVKGYSEPQYYHLRHFCVGLGEGDDFVTCHVEIRGRDIASLTEIWEKGNNSFVEKQPLKK